MTASPSRAAVLFAAAILRIPARRIRALAMGDERALHDWVANESATRLAEARRDARLALARLAESGGRIVTLTDPSYPRGLLDLRDPPAFLCVRGTIGPAFGPVGTAIVGTRTPLARSTAFARALSQRAEPPIVSGLALGIDAAAHRGALEARVATIAYLGNGLGATYPPEHRDLEDAIVAAGGGVASELIPGEAVTRWALTRRDRLQAAHAARLVLVESDLGGGAMHAMRAARAVERPWFACEPLPDADFSGNVRALRDGATALPWDVERAGRMLAR